MPKTITVAAVQLDGTPDSTAIRLERAAQQIAQAAQVGAQLIVLPELFNTGSSYAETNYEVTEKLNGMTFQWLCEQAQKYQVYLVGSFLVVDVEDTYNAAFLLSPDGRSWRYDKQFPYLWERVYYREGRTLTIAETAIGRIGIMIGWDAGHADTWKRYAGHVDILVVLHDMQDISEAALAFPDESSVYVHDLGFLVSLVADDSSLYLGDDLERQAQWARVPVVCAGASGEFRSIFPSPYFTVSLLTLLRPELWERADKYYADAELVAPFSLNTRIIDASGTTIAKVDEQGDQFTVAELTLPDLRPIPDGDQPSTVTPALAYPLVDVIGEAFYANNYRRSVRRQWGARYSPMDTVTRKWLGIVMVAMVLGAILGQLFPRRRKKS